MKENKKEFVEKYLQPMIKEADSAVKSVTYRDPVYGEMVVVEYIGGATFRVCITCDSKQAIVKDVLREIW